MTAPSDSPFSSPTTPSALCQHCGGHIEQVDVVDFTNGIRRVKQWVHVSPVHHANSALCPRMHATPAVTR